MTVKPAARKPAPTPAEVERICDLAGQLSNAMGRVELKGLGIGLMDWYAVNRILHATAPK